MDITNALFMQDASLAHGRDLIHFNVQQVQPFFGKLHLCIEKMNGWGDCTANPRPLIFHPCHLMRECNGWIAIQKSIIILIYIEKL